MDISRANALSFGGAILLAVTVFTAITQHVHSPVLLPLLIGCTMLLAGYHAYDGGSPRSTILIPLIVVSGVIVGVRVNDMSGCGPIPGCLPATQLQTYLEWTLFAVILGIIVYLVGFVTRERLPFRT